MPVKNRVIYDIERCVCKVPDACTDCSKRREGLVPLECMEELMKDALELLKEQEAKPVIVTTNAYGTRFYHCPKCNRDLYAYPRQLYCSNCGQAVKWDDT